MAARECVLGDFELHENRWLPRVYFLPDESGIEVAGAAASNCLSVECAALRQREADSDEERKGTVEGFHFGEEFPRLLGRDGNGDFAGEGFALWPGDERLFKAVRCSDEKWKREQEEGGLFTRSIHPIDDATANKIAEERTDGHGGGKERRGHDDAQIPFQSGKNESYQAKSRATDAA